MISMLISFSCPTPGSGTATGDGQFLLIFRWFESKTKKKPLLELAISSSEVGIDYSESGNTIS
jgi:hypothetical protein